MTKFNIVLFVYLASIITSLLQAEDHILTSNSTKGAEIDLVATQLRICPCWTDVAPDDLKKRREITDTYVKLSIYNTKTLRAGIKNMFGTYPTLEDDAKVFALLRVLFKLPNRFTVTGPPPVLMGNPFHNDGSVNLLWPYSKGNDGCLVLTGGTGKFYFGGVVWNELVDFDNTASRFERRPVKIEKP